MNGSLRLHPLRFEAAEQALFKDPSCVCHRRNGRPHDVGSEDGRHPYISEQVDENYQGIKTMHAADFLLSAEY